MSFTRAGIAQILSLGGATVKFTKVSDGSERVMYCTIAPHLIPEEKKSSGPLLTEVPVNQSYLRVFDLEVGDWRSFRIDTVQEVSVGAPDTSSGKLLLG